MKIDRAIIASDENQNYIQFWPIVAKSWSLIGIKPTLFLISNDLQVDESFGDVIRVKPIREISSALQAQCVRLLAPTMFPDDVSVVSDIDMMPLNYEYFVDQILGVKNDSFVIFSSDAYENISNFPCFPMCYNAALGSVFEEIFGYTMDEYDGAMKKWHSLDHGWTTDERVLYAELRAWDKYREKCVLLRRGWSPLATGRIDRANMKFNPHAMLAKRYVDFHMVRPYEQYKEVIDYIFECFEASMENS